ncbi:hypothetical protein [Aetokthonos hydrillicola]|nr:hypothetical protein [Aetokthonos hydrillicola]MBO3459140.1 hypothetical protein [Aetokthonos hydrillicola CCALA 1050]MBW4584686.1 hypothetical protein [Aetokthonos hydrillicola CCALA 1050]
MKVQSVKDTFSSIMSKLYEAHLPSKHPFFHQLASFTHSKLPSSDLLGELYIRYQAACHATRVMVYHLPHLDRPDWRVRKCSIIKDDDSGEIHHYQLKNAFAHIGADIVEDEKFGSLNKLQTILDPVTAGFVYSVQNLYPQSLGPWCVIEMFADDWMRALMNSLSNCFPSITEEPYFADCLDQGIEQRHAQEALDLTGEVLVSSPDLLEQTIEDAHKMAVELDKFWSGLQNLLTEHELKLGLTHCTNEYLVH